MKKRLHPSTDLVWEEARIGHAAERSWLCWMSCGGSPWGRMGLFAVAEGAAGGNGGLGGGGTAVWIWENQSLFLVDLFPAILYYMRGDLVIPQKNISKRF